MAHLDVAKDLSLYNKLMDAFTICDDYHCSTHTGTDPTAPIFIPERQLENKQQLFFQRAGPRPDWKTYPERLQKLGVDWKIYQNCLGETYSLTISTTILEDFKQYMDPGRDLAKDALIVNTVLRNDPDVLSVLEKDIAEGTLPAVSWIAAPDAFCEHPRGISPHFGEYYVNEILKALAAHPEVWKKTVFIINYDENDGFFDHVPPPLPPLPSVKDVGKVSDGIEISTRLSERFQYRTCVGASGGPCHNGVCTLSGGAQGPSDDGSWLPSALPYHIAMDRRRACLLRTLRPYLDIALSGHLACGQGKQTTGRCSRISHPGAEPFAAT